MVAPIKQIVTVGEDGRIELRASGFPAGTRAEVTVTPVATGTEPTLEAFRTLQTALKLDQATAEAWAKEVRAERDATHPRP